MFESKKTKYEKLKNWVPKIIETDYTDEYKNRVDGSFFCLAEVIRHKDLELYLKFDKKALSLIYKAVDCEFLNPYKLDELNEKYIALLSLRHIGMGTEIPDEEFFENCIKCYLCKGYLSDESVSVARKVRDLSALLSDKFNPKSSDFDYYNDVNCISTRFNIESYIEMIDQALDKKIINDSQAKIFRSCLKLEILEGAQETLKNNKIFSSTNRETIKKCLEFVLKENALNPRDINNISKINDFKVAVSSLEGMYEESNSPDFDVSDYPMDVRTGVYLRLISAKDRDMILDLGDKFVKLRDEYQNVFDMENYERFC